MGKKVGKCFSKVDRGQRKKGDRYQTPYSMTQQLLENEQFDKIPKVLEPACGDCAISRILEVNGFSVDEYDIEDEGYDFLEEDKKYATIITNPPYSLAFEFVEKAKEICAKFAFLLKLDFLSGQKRFEKLYSKLTVFPLVRVYVFSRMPLLTEEVRSDGKYETAMQTYAWYVWELQKKAQPNRPEIYWLDCSGNVLGKGDKR